MIAKITLITVYAICIYALEFLMSCLTLEQWVELFYVDLYPSPQFGLDKKICSKLKWYNRTNTAYN